MKKQIIASFSALGLCFATGVAFAAPTAFQDNVTVTSGVGNNCAMLSRDVVLGVSAKVHGAYDCDEVLNLVKVAACHEGGSRSGVVCSNLTPPTVDEPNRAASYAAGCNAGLAATASTSPVPSYKAFFTSSAGGVMNEQPLDGRCNAATIVNAGF